MYKSITPDYYGYRDEDDGVIVAKEVVQEVSVRYVRQLKSRCDMI